MARNRFKQRIVGGVVLVALGAIVIPFLLDMHQESEWWGTGNIPKKPDNGFVTRVLPLEEWSKQAQSELAEGTAQLNAPSPTGDINAQSPAGGTSDQARAAKGEPPAATGSPPAAVARAADDVKEGWVVQLGSFSNEKNAEELREQLRKMGYRVFVERLKQGGQTVYRVRVGPEAQRDAAEAIRDRLERDVKLKAMVMSFP